MTGPRSRMLVVDDDPDIRELLSDRLQLMRLEVAGAGEEALARPAGTRPGRPRPWAFNGRTYPPS